CQYSADTAVMGRLYKKLVTKGVLTDKSFINPTAGEFYRYLEQEGRERYFYLTPDEMIAFVASESVATLRDYAMVPDIASSKSNRSIAREKYDRYLQNTFTVRPIEPGVDKDMLTPRESKRIIHFVKLPTSAALNSLGALVESDPDS